MLMFILSFEFFFMPVLLKIIDLINLPDNQQEIATA